MPRRLRLSISITRCEIVTHFPLAYYCSHIGAITISYVTVPFLGKFREERKRRPDTFFPAAGLQRWETSQVPFGKRDLLLLSNIRNPVSLCCSLY